MYLHYLPGRGPSEGVTVTKFYVLLVQINITHTMQPKIVFAVSNNYTELLCNKSNITKL